MECPRCGYNLVKRTNGKTGKLFIGCSKFPACTFTRNFSHKPADWQVCKAKTITLYILQLQENKYYIGRSKNSKDRIQQHFNGEGCVWTKKYPPVVVVKHIEGCDIFDEDKYTKMYMSKYGIDNVRGGSYSQVILDEAAKKLLQAEIWGAQDRCFKCGGDHFSKDHPRETRSWWSAVKSWLYLEN